MKDIPRNKTTLSIMMTAYNSEKYIAETIESILSQTYTDFEFVIIDDGSDDRTYDICRIYALEDSRIRLHQNNQNKGVVKTRNMLLSKISKNSKYIAIIDADDVAYKNRLEKQLKFLKENLEYSIVGSDIDIINETGKVIGGRIYPHSHEEVSKTIFQRSPVAQPAVMVKVEVFDTLGGYDERFERCQDYELWCRAFDAGYKIGNISDKLMRYRVYSEQGKTRHLKLSLRNTIKIQKKYIFQKKYFSLKSFFYFIAENILAIFPNSFILWVFKKITY